MIRTIYVAPAQYLSAAKTVKRYIRSMGDKYQWCIQDQDTKWDVAQGYCDADDLPPVIKQLCEFNVTCHYACEWVMLPHEFEQLKLKTEAKRNPPARSYSQFTPSNLAV